MVLYVVDVPPALDAEVRRLVSLGRYRSVAHAGENALELLIQLHNQPGRLNPEAAVQGARVGQSAREAVLDSSPTRDLFSRVPTPNIPTVPPEKQLEAGLLWGVPRSLPLKVVTRVLANCAEEKPGVSLAEFLAELRPNAFRVGRYLAGVDKKQGRKFGDHLSTGFPSEKEDAEASWQRFTEQYVFVSRKKVGNDGASYKLGLIATDEKTIRLTPDGLQLACARSPLETYPSDVEDVLSEEERAILLRAFGNHAEGGHIRAFLSALNNGADSPAEVLGQMWGYYDSLRNGEKMTEAYANSLRGGLVGRLKELRLIEVERRGTQAHYRLTPTGIEYLATLGG